MISFVLQIPGEFDHLPGQVEQVTGRNARTKSDQFVATGPIVGIAG